MKLEQQTWTQATGWSLAETALGDDAQLVLLFGSRDVFAEGKPFDHLRKAYPKALLFGCSTAGEIAGTQVLDDSLVSTAVRFEDTRIQSASVSMSQVSDSSEAGRQLAAALPPEGLVHVFVISDGQQVNGSELVRGLLEKLPERVQVTGGLAGDGARFEKTLVFANGEAMEGVISAIGLYGTRLKIGYGSLGGWDPFGPERKVTRSEGNVLFELDGEPALQLYKKYLGEHADGLPATGLLFPLSIRSDSGGESLVRTILAVDDQAQSLTFAGDVPEGVYARLMKANFERLIDGASGAARSSYDALGGAAPDLAILISCVGRKLVLKQRTEEEVEEVQSVLGDATIMTGFYSYGEICPAAPSAGCELHNQTMTITTFSER
jgi:hypothetical protein